MIDNDANENETPVLSMYVFCAPAFFVRNQRQGRKLLISTRRWKLYIHIGLQIFSSVCVWK